MKKIKLVGLVSILTLSFFTTSKVLAEPVSTELENNITETTEASTSESHLETSSDSSILEDSTSLPQNKDDKIEIPATTPSIVDMDFSSEITAFHKKGDKISAIDFQVGIEKLLNKKLTNYRFETGEGFIANTLGIHVTKILADLDEKTTYLITCSYSVQNNINTIPAPELSYDAKTHVLNGTTLPKHKINFYKVGLAGGEDFKLINTIADESGSFSISANNFERGRLMVAVVSSPDGIEFSNGTQFKIPLADTTQSTAESTGNSDTKPSENTTNSAKPNSSKGKELPSTGEKYNIALKTSGVLALFGFFCLLLMKKRNVKE